MDAKLAAVVVAVGHVAVVLIYLICAIGLLSSSSDPITNRRRMDAWFFGGFFGISLTFIFSGLIWGRCPLTILEEALRARAGMPVEYGQPFISRLTENMFGFSVLPEVITGTVLLFFLSVSLFFSLLRYRVMRSRGSS